MATVHGANLAVYYGRTVGSSGGEIVRHADTQDRRTRRRLGIRKTRTLPGLHRRTDRVHRWASARVSVWRGLALLAAACCVVLSPLAVVSVAVKPPGSAGSSYHPTWPWSGHQAPGSTFRAPRVIVTPGAVPAESPGDLTASGSPSVDPAGTPNPPTRPSSEAAPTPVGAPDVTPTGSPAPTPIPESPTRSASPPCGTNLPGPQLTPGAMPSVHIDPKGIHNGRQAEQGHQ
jgi:hypothetical protein